MIMKEIEKKLRDYVARLDSGTLDESKEHPELGEAKQIAEDHLRKDPKYYSKKANA